jgi:hypothetical protein
MDQATSELVAVARENAEIRGLILKFLHLDFKIVGDF